MSRDHSMISARGIILWSVVGLSIMFLLTAIITSSYLLAGLSMACSLVILALYNSRHNLLSAAWLFGPHAFPLPAGQNDRQTTSLGVQDPTSLPGHEWLAHSLYPVSVADKDLRVLIGNAQCCKPYNISLFNIGAATSSSLTNDDIAALNRGAALGDFAQNTGDGGIHPHHFNGGDLVWQIGSGYTGCCDDEGRFFPELFRINAAHAKVKMIELKLPLTAAQASFSNPIEMVQFLGVLRRLSGGKPIGFNIRIGNKHEFIDICNAIQVTRIVPDFITIQGNDAGPADFDLSYSGNMGIPFYDALAFVKETLDTFNMREQIRIIAAGSTNTAFDILKVVALGADACCSSGNIIQALNYSPAATMVHKRSQLGIAPTDELLTQVINVNVARTAVAHYHRDTLAAVVGLMETCGFKELKDVNPAKFFRRIDPLRTRNFHEIYFNHIDDRLRDGWFKACMLN